MAWGYQSAKSAGQSVQESLLLHQPHAEPFLQMDQVCGVRTQLLCLAEQEQGPAASGCSELHAVTDTPAEQSISSYNHGCSQDTALAR